MSLFKHILSCSMTGHKWKFSMDGGKFGFAGRVSILTGKDEVCYTCQRCLKYKWVENTFTNEQIRKMGKDAGWYKMDGKRLR